MYLKIVRQGPAEASFFEPTVHNDLTNFKLRNRNIRDQKQQYDFIVHFVGILFHGDDFFRLRLFRTRWAKLGRSEQQRCADFVPEADTLSSVRASYGRLTLALTAAAESQQAAQCRLLVVARRTSRDPLAAIEQFYRLRLNKIAAAEDIGLSQSRQYRRYLRRRLPVNLCSLDFGCVDTK